MLGINRRFGRYVGYIIRLLFKISPDAFYDLLFWQEIASGTGNTPMEIVFNILYHTIIEVSILLCD